MGNEREPGDRDSGAAETEGEVDGSAKPLGRRSLLKVASATLSTIALGPLACSDASEPGSDTPAQSGGGMGGAPPGGGAGASAGQSGTGGAGTGAGGAGTGVNAGAGGGTSGTGAAGTGDAGMPAAGSGGAAAAEDGGAGPGDGRVTVAIVHRAELDEAVARAVELAGGLDAIQPGDSVFIKVNAVSDRAIGTPGIRTSNEMIAAVVRLIKSRNPGRIIVGDRSARQFPNTEAVFMNAGIGEAALAAGADEIYAAPAPNADPDAWMLLQPPDYGVAWMNAGGILCMRKILEADHLINVPTCKNHRYALFSLSMKNFIGAIGDSSRDPLHFAETFGADFTPIGRDIAVLNQPFSPLMNILDATTALINGGPQGDGADAVRTSPGLVFASRDRVALDAAAVSLIKLELSRTNVSNPDAANPRLTATAPFMFPQIVEASARGLGAGSADEVRLAFDDVADAAELEAIFRS